MKTFKTSNLFAFAIIAFFSFSLTSCEKTELTATNDEIVEQLRFSKDIQVTDTDGLNSITLSLSTDNEALLDNYNARTFSLKPYFTPTKATPTINEIPEISEAQEDDADDFNESVLIETTKKNLQNGVIGYQLVKSTFSESQTRACNKNYNVFKDSKDFVDIDVTGGITGKIIVSRKNGLIWTQVMNVCASNGDTFNNRGWSGSSQIKVKVSNVLGVNLNFHN